MTVHKSTTFIEAYRAKAGCKDINELSGRTGRPDLTQFVMGQLLSKLHVDNSSTVVDIGCGDGLFLQLVGYKCQDFSGRLIGILPTREEVSRVRQHLLNPTNPSCVSIEVGLLDSTNLPAAFADIVVSNGTFLLLQTEYNVNAALREIRRITKSGGTIFIGELPEVDEMAGKDYGDSISSWLLWVLRNRGIIQFVVRLRQVVSAVISAEPFVIGPKHIFFASPREFIRLLESHGFQALESYRHREIDAQGRIYESQSRWDYRAVKT